VVDHVNVFVLSNLVTMQNLVAVWHTLCEHM